MKNLYVTDKYLYEKNIIKFGSLRGGIPKKEGSEVESLLLHISLNIRILFYCSPLKTMRNKKME
jgi:hypothetical protein